MLSSKIRVIIEKLNSDDERTVRTPASPCSFERQGIGDLVLDLARAAAHPVGEDDDLVFAQVGDRVHGRVQHGVDGEQGQRRRHDQDQEAVADRVLDQFFNHGLFPFVSTSISRWGRTAETNR
jgi:hypothetical protein